MAAQLAFLEVHGPDGQESSVDLIKDRVTIGRYRDFNDVSLEPDPQQLVTRKAHCAVERDAEGWWVVDNGSVNRTFLRRGQTVEVVNGRAQILDGDVIRILGRLVEGGEPAYWELVFRDPLKTQRAVLKSLAEHLEYDWIQARLFRVDGQNREEIHGLRPQEHKLIRFMDQRNRANENVPVMCTYEELITAIWGDEPYHTEGELTHLIWELRQGLEPDPKQPRFLQTVRGLGYRLVTMPWVK
ncbi:MAG: winged helix-turn-helix domain-containing protein [Anaerolineales bacterium]|nr:winged helix-turn-helix domain-containing protein [Anaerolineales bacterium]